MVAFEFEFRRPSSNWPSGRVFTRLEPFPRALEVRVEAVRGSRRPARGQVILEPENSSPRDLQWRDAVSLLAACGGVQSDRSAPEGADAGCFCILLISPLIPPLEYIDNLYTNSPITALCCCSLTPVDERRP